jgi:hypothetical protein
MTRKQREALANFHGWLMLATVHGVAGLVWSPWILFAWIACMIIAVFHQHEFIKD